MPAPYDTGTELAKGCLLVAAPSLTDPNFWRSVVYLIEYSDDGALGVVVNRRSDSPLGSTLPAWGGVASKPEVLFVGGPVSPENAIALATFGSVETFEQFEDIDGPAGWSKVAGAVGTVDLTGDPLEVAIWSGGVRVFAGYAGWGAGQLEGEVAQSAWFVVPSEPADVISSDPDEIWKQVLRRQGGRLAMLANYPPHASFN